MEDNILDKVNRSRQEQYDRISAQIKQLEAIRLISTVLLHQLRSDPSFRYGNIPITEDPGDSAE